jgi:hypothetical protein
MPLVLKDRVKETASSPGTGTVTLLGASTGYQSFSAIGDGNTTYYTIADQSGANWEVGIGTYTSSGTTLSRDTILASSNSGSIVNFSSGTQDVFCDYPAGKTAIQNANGYVQNTIFEATNGLIVNNMTVSASYTIPSGYSASSVGPVTVAGGVSVTVPSGSRWVVL